MNHLVVKSDVVHKIPLNELQIVVIENPNVTITGHLLNALTEKKIVTNVCGKNHMPQTFVQPIYGHHRQARLVNEQMEWTNDKKMLLWKKIIEQKIKHQYKLLQHFQSDKEHFVIKTLMENVELDDATNREGQAARIYFNTIFDEGFTRGDIDAKNAALDYGYQVLLAIFVKTIVCKGYLTELGIKHRNEFNLYNLASDFMEVYRPVVDYRVLKYINNEFERNEKRKILDMVNDQVVINKKRYYLQNSIELYVESLLNYLKTGNEQKLAFPVWHYK